MTAKKDTTVRLTLSNGKKAEFDPQGITGHSLMKAREASGGISTVIYLISEIATFDGEKLPAPEVLNFSAYDIIALEQAWADANPNA